MIWTLQGRYIPNPYDVRMLYSARCRVGAVQSAWSRKGFPGLHHLHYTDPAKRLTTAGGNLDDLDCDG